MKGICFKPHLHELTVQGIKNQTRRIIVSRTGYFQVCSKNGVITNIWQTDADEWTGDNLIPVKPRYNVGEVLYLKEPYRFAPDVDSIIYKFDYPSGRYTYPGCDKVDTPVKWENKLFMPSKYARTFIEITAVRAERLQDISDEDCIREGILKFTKDDTIFKYGVDGWKWDEMPRTPKEAYKVLINQINGKDTWDSNPYVWVYDYELVQPPSPL